MSPYAKSPKSVLKVLDYLEIIARNDRASKYETIFSTSEPNLLAYRFREAKYHFSTHDDLDPRIKHLSFITDYQFKIRGNAIIARRITPLAVEVKEVEVPAIASSQPPQEVKLVTVPVSSVQDIIMYVIEHKTNEVLAFTFKDGPIINEAKLDRWCAANHYIPQYNGETATIILRKSL